MSIESVTTGPERELRDRSRLDRLDLELTTALRTAQKLVGDIAWGELAALNIAVDTINQGGGQLAGEAEWERLVAGLNMVEVAAAALYQKARGELRRFEFDSCETPGPVGCGDCDGCRAWGDKQHDLRGDR